jgi:hypothetical protein
LRDSVRALGCIVFISDAIFRFNHSLIRWFGTKADATQRLAVANTTQKEKK